VGSANVVARRLVSVLLSAGLVLASVSGTGVRAAPERPRVAASELKPSIEWKKIPFGARRRRQMAAYSKRHYGERAWELTDPHVVVEHFTGGNSLDAAWNYFAANSPHLGERPGVCSHFLVDTDGVIYQLVNLRLRCRHAIGMNWTAIGVEMVGTSDREILRNGPQIRAALRLTLWLIARYGISVGNVIGHAETLSSPYHHELYEGWRCMTHADWSRKDMRTFRHRLKRLARRHDVPIGPRPERVDSGC
jgi:beta-N-acetylhexosaminidase